MKEFKNYCGRGFAYNTYVCGNDKLFPNSRDEVIKKKDKYDPRLIAKFNVTTTTETTSLFNNPTILKEIEIDGVKYTGNDIYSHYNHTFDTTGIHTVKYTLADGITAIDISSFNGKTNMVSITIPDSVTSIGGGTFNNCTSLTSVTIPNSVTSISNGAFEGCTSLTTITIPNSVTSIGGSLGSFNFEDVVFESVNPNPTFVRDATNKVLTNIAGDTLVCGFNNTVAIPNSVTTIGQYAFSSCSGLMSVTIPNGVTSIGGGAFLNCTGLTNLTIPNSVISIGDRAFDGCSRLTSVTIGNSVTSIGNSAFYGCSGLTSITSLATTAPTISNTTFQNVKTGGTLYVPSGSTGYDVWMGTGDYYLGKYNWILYDPVRFVAKFDITDTSSATPLFNNPTLLSKLEIDGVEYTGNDIFSHYNHTFSTTGIHTVKYTLTDGTTSIDSSTFAGKNNMVSITIPDSITTISSAFASCSGLTSIRIPDSVTTIGGGAFSACSGLTSINIPSGVTTIGGSAFYGCSLTSITIPKSVITIGGGAFSCNFNFEDVIFEAINPNATFIVDTTNKVIIDTTGNTLLLGFNNTVTIPNTITTIGNNAFSCCADLASVTIPSNVITIGGGAFSDCTGLISITSLAKLKPGIQNNTFFNVKTGGTLYIPTGSDYGSWMGIDSFYLGKYNWTLSYFEQ